MKPMPLRRRRIFLAIFFVLFVCAIPIVFMYAQGYRIGPDGSLVRTGGIYVHAPIKNIQFTLNKGEQQNLSFFQNSFFIQDLTPNFYDIEVSKDGYITWAKKVKVLPELVAEFSPFLIPKKPLLTEIPKYLSTTTQVVSPDYNALLGFFSVKPIAPNIVSTTTLPDLVSGKIAIYIKNKGLLVEWRGNLIDIPDFFCSYTACTATTTILSNIKVKRIDFLPGRNDVVIYSTDTGIYVAELDQKTPQNNFQIYDSKSVDFKVGPTGVIYVKDGLPAQSGIKIFTIDIS